MELLRLLGQAGRERVASDPCRLVEARACHHEGPGHSRIAGRLVDRISLSSEETLVDLKALRGQDGAIDNELVARCEDHDVVEHHLVGAHLHVGSVTANGRFRLADHRELRESSRGPVLLDDADEGVCNDDEAEKRILERRDHNHDRPHDPDDEVEPGERVRADDVGEAAASSVGRVVNLPRRHPLGDLCHREPLLEVDHDGRPSILTSIMTGDRPFLRPS